MSNPMEFSVWIIRLRSRFEQPEEFDLARAIYPFEEDWHCGLSPQASYEKFDSLVRCEDVA